MSADARLMKHGDVQRWAMYDLRDRMLADDFVLSSLPALRERRDEVAKILFAHKLVRLRLKAQGYITEI